ncbi:MAG: immunoglobulin-like domain-containing protein [Planctomycetota bacterium]
MAGNSGHGWAIPSQARTLGPDDEVTLKFDVTTRHNLETTNEFLVTLRAPHGKVYDKIWVVFDTKKHGSEYSWQKYEKNEASKPTLPDDTNAPVITLNGPNTMVLECGVDSYVELGADANDDTDPCVIVLIGGDTVDTSTCGTYVVAYSAIDSWCHFALVTRTVEVVDTTPPVITLIGPNTVVLQLGDDYVEQGATAADNCDDDVPVVIGGDTVDTSTPGTYLVTYDAVDDCGNSASQVIRTVIVQAIPPDCSGAYAGPDCLWPPFHQMVPVKILGVTDPDGDDITITITAITSDEPTASDKGSGGAKHAPDADGVGTDTALLRAERSGKRNGRVYVISFTAVDGQGAECQASVRVNVPHDRRPLLRWPVPCQAVDDGQNYDATQMN